MSKDRGLKTRVTISSTIDKDVQVKLKAYSDETGIPISKILDRAIIAYLNTFNLPSGILLF